MRGALLLHPFTGDPGAMAGLARALEARGFRVESPWFTGHAGDEAALLAARWEDWVADAERGYAALAGCEPVVVLGLSMGGGLACLLATRHPEIAAVVAINPVIEPAPAPWVASLRRLLALDLELLPEARPDIADPDVVVPERPSPIAGLLSLFDGVAAVDWRDVRCPLLLVTGALDKVVDPASGDRLAAVVSGPVERVILPRSAHIATLDYDQEVLVEAAVRFVERVTGA